METVIHDLRVGLRSLRLRPTFFAVAVITLALGIGTSTAIYAVIDAALLRPLLFAAPSRLAMVWGVAGPQQDIRGGSPIEIADWRRLTKSFDDLSVYNATSLNLSGEGEARQLRAETVSPGYMNILGVPPALGRTLVAEDDRAGAVGAALISDDLWRTRFGGDPAILGRGIQLDGRSFTVVGVMPPGFRGLSFDTEIWVPLGPLMTEQALQSRGSRWLGAVGRLKPGVSPAAAQADLTAAARQLEEQFPDINRQRGALLMSLRQSLIGSARPLLLTLLSGVLLLLFIACANVANLQLVRTSDRRRELSLRHALGASQGRVIRQLVTESAGLSVIGGAAGVAVAWAALRVLLPLIPQGALPNYVDVRLAPGVVGFAVLVALVAGAALGVVPALRTEASPADALKGARSSAAGWRTGRLSLQQFIVGGEVAVALVLLAAAGLAIKSFRAQLAIAPGFDAANVLAAQVSLTGNRYDRAGRRRFIDALLAEVGGLPGVRQAAVGSDAPLRGATSAAILSLEDQPDRRIRYYRHIVTPDYFRALGIPITRGRGFIPGDGTDSSGVALVTEAFAARLWRGEDPLGKRFRIGSDIWVTVVGIAGNVHFRDLTTDLMDPAGDPDVYFSADQFPPGTFEVVVRAGGDPAALTPAIRRIVSGLDAAIPLYNAELMQRTLAAQTALGRLASSLLALFGGLSLLLAAIGLYGVMAFIVRGRRREMAIRSAVGATPEDIQRLVMGQGMRVVGAGLVLGGIGALAAGRLLAGSLYGVRPADPLVLGLTTAALLVSALAANWLPALQAARVDPQGALAAE